MFGRSFILSLALAASLLTAAGPRLLAQPAVIDREYEIKAAYLYNFGLYIEWPKNAFPGDDKFVIGVLGPNPFGGSLDAIAAKKTIQGKKIVVRKFASIKDYQPCHILFISGEADAQADEKTAEERAKAALEKTKGSPVLLVADTMGLAQKGVMMNFVIEENKINIEVNLDAAKRAGLKISSKLLGLSIIRIVKGSAASKSRELEYYARIP